MQAPFTSTAAAPSKEEAALAAQLADGQGTEAVVSRLSILAGSWQRVSLLNPESFCRRLRDWLLYPGAWTVESGHPNVLVQMQPVSLLRPRLGHG